MSKKNVLVCAEGKHDVKVQLEPQWRPGTVTVNYAVAVWVANPKRPNEGCLRLAGTDSSEDTVDEKDSAALMTMKKSLTMAKTSGKAGGRGSKMTGEVRGIWLAYKYTSTSSANAANTSVGPLQPGSSTEIASWAVLYDEFNCDMAEFYFNITTAGNPVMYGVAYDPVNAGTYGSVAAVSNATDMILGSIPAQPGSATMAVVGHNGAGLRVMRVKVPKMGSARDSSSSSVFGGSDWAATGTYGNNVWGFFKPYVEAAGSGQTTTIFFGIVRMRCNFRMRS